jgi:3-hydroxyacyl-[acyl-carrier-protein] dehydratase
MGHFPGHPVMPGVLVLEALAQAGGILAWESVSDDDGIWILYLVGIDDARFKQPVRPGDQLMLKVELVQRRRNLWRYTARAEVDGKLVAEAEFLMADGPKS